MKHTGMCGGRSAVIVLGEKDLLLRLLPFLRRKRKEINPLKSP